MYVKTLCPTRRPQAHPRRLPRLLQGASQEIPMRSPGRQMSRAGGGRWRKRRTGTTGRANEGEEKQEREEEDVRGR
eukprot:9099832-Pyramimonas_sp.AAC.1